MILKNAEVFAYGKDFITTDIKIENGKIVSLEKTDAPGEDFSGKKILPGFIDIHIHGCGGADACDAKAESLEKMSGCLASKGVTSFCPATMTLPKEELKKVFAAIGNEMGKEKGAYIHGINMEGPFISKEKAGAQAKEHIIPPDIALFKELNAI